MKIPTEVRLCWDFFLGGALVSSAPTEQKCTNRAELHHLLCWCSRDCCTPWKAPRKHCTNRANHKRLCWGAWVWQGCHTLLQLLALMRFEPVLAPTRVSHERHVQRIGVLHLFDNNLFYTLLLLR